MSVHLIGSNKLEPAFGSESGESESLDFENWLLAAGNAIPLFWFFIFKSSDLKFHPINHDEEEAGSWEAPLNIPSTESKLAAKNLKENLPLLDEWFGEKGSLQYHVELFSNWLESIPYKYVTLDWYEPLAEGEEESVFYEECITRIENKDISIRSKLIEESTIDPSVRFITLDEAKEGKFTSEEQHNFFFLLGDGDYHQPPWS
ncbi:MAG: hypothetical protein K6L75_02680 [Cellvibrionaceae bacterium]